LREPFNDFIKRKLDFKIVLITCGLPGTWKTETAAEVSKIKDIPVFRSDLIRLEILKNEDIFDPKVASNMNKRMAVYNELFRRAEKFVINNKKSVILDATFVAQNMRESAAKIAANNDMVLAILQTSCSEQSSINRILRRTKEKYESNALTEEAYQHNKKKFEPVNINNLKNLYPDLSIIHFTVDTEYDHPDKWYVIDLERT
jgi:predicted kinase